MKTVPQILVVGAGFSGAVMARELAERGSVPVRVIDRRPHIAGNCHTERDAKSGVMLHVYGPHIFNTDNERVWKYIHRFGKMMPFVNRVKAMTKRGLFSLPINLMTINQFFEKNMRPQEAKDFLVSLGDATIDSPKNFEEQALKMLGHALYDNFFYGYTKKQWGCEPRELPASVLKRLPVRFNYDDNYYAKKYQGIPENGYTEIVRKILDHPLIQTQLDTPFTKADRNSFHTVIYTGPLDEYFDYSEGHLGYRTVEFERIDAEGDYQGTAIINYTDEQIPWTRILEHKHFAPWETHDKTVAFKEFSKETGLDDEPYYPKRLAVDKVILEKYQQLTNAEKNVIFLGRLATYRYMDMEAVIGEALECADRWLTVNL